MSDAWMRRGKSIEDGLPDFLSVQEMRERKIGFHLGYTVLLGNKWEWDEEKQGWWKRGYDVEPTP